MTPGTDPIRKTKNKAYQDIDAVLEELDRIIDESILKDDFTGLFAYVYRRTTAEIKRCIDEKRFLDNERMAEFDILFAGLYIDAYHQYRRGEEPSQSWRICFEARQTRASIAQHILMGMNAHINLDLGIAAAGVADGADREELKSDFDLVNQILRDLIDEMQARISRASRLLYVLDFLGGRRDERFIETHIARFRGAAWESACMLMDVEVEDEKLRLIQELDERTAGWSRLILHPPNLFLKMAWRLLGLFEIRRVDRIIESLRSDEKPLIRI